MLFRSANYALKKNVGGITPSGDSSFKKDDARPLQVSAPDGGVNAFTTKAIGQSSAEPAADNEITITLASNVPLTAADPATKVTISGLAGALLRADTCNNSVTDHNCTETAVANGAGALVTFMDMSTHFKPSSWDNSKKKIVLAVTADTMPGTKYVLKFFIKNPSHAQSSPRVHIESNGIPIPPAAMTNPDSTTLITTIDENGAAKDADKGFASPLAVLAPKLFAKSVFQKASGEWPGSDNMLTIAFKSTVELKSTTSTKVALVVKGLNGARLERGSVLVASGAPDVNMTSDSAAANALLVECTAGSSSNVHMYPGGVPPFDAIEKADGGADAGCPACPAVPKCPLLDGTGGQSKLTVGVDEIAANTMVEFTVKFKNALEAQASQSLTIEVVSCDARYVIPPTVIPVKAAYKGTNQEPLYIVASAPFTVKKICQSSPCTSATNTITVSLQPKFVLTGAKSAEITIRGLKGSDSPDGLVTLLTGTPTFEPKARWKQSSGTLILRVAAGKTVPIDKVTVVQLDITNPRYQQAAPETIEISASGDVPHAPMCMDVCSGYEAPLSITAGTFTSASVNASTTVAGADNTVTVEVKPTCSLLCEGRDSVVTIEGLVGSKTPDRTLLPVTMVSGSATLFKSNMPVHVSFTHSCALSDNKAVLTGVSGDPVDTLLQFTKGKCKDRYTKITAFDAETGCATLEQFSSGVWSDGSNFCLSANGGDVGAVESIAVRNGGTGFKAGSFIVDSTTGSGLAGTCAVDPTGKVTSITVTAGGEGYSADTVVRCPRACPIEQKRLVSSCGCGCGCGCGCNTTTDAACEPVDDFGLKVTTSLAELGPVVAGACSWSKDAGRLTCPIQGCMNADAATKFSFSIANGDYSQCGQTVNVMAGGSYPLGAVALTGKAMEIVASSSPTESAIATCVCRSCGSTTGPRSSSLAGVTPALNASCVTPGNSTHGAKCTCTAKFSDLDSTKTYALGADMQCNVASTIKSIKVAGTDSASALGAVTQASADTCNDKCSTYHRLFSGIGIDKTDTSSGSLEVEVESETIAGAVDYCGSGDMFKAVLSITALD